jgi:hypothetical protein
MKTAIVTTFSDKGFQEYGHWFVDSVAKFLDSDLQVYIYVDSVNPRTDIPNLTVRRLEPSVPDLTAFKARHRDRPVAKFLYDGVRFSHKSYCIWHCATNCDADRLIWIDSDTEILASITAQWLNGFLPNDKFVGYLGREGRYTETGFLIFDLKQPHAREFFDRWKHYYDSDEIWNLSGQLDCHVFDACLEEFQSAGKLQGHDLCGDVVKKSHFNTVFTGYLVHYKGDDKQNRDKHYSKAIRSKGKSRS